MTTLFDIAAYSTPPIPVQDPYWDEIVLDVNPKPDPTGQLTLFYDDSQEPPEPDDFPSIEEYYQAWVKWERRYPDLAVLVGEQASNEPKNLSQGSSLAKKNSKQVALDTAHQHTQWVEIYYVCRSGRKHYYLRFSWMQNRKIERVYIGSVKSPTSQAIAQKVRQAIARQESPTQIKELIRSSKINLD